MVAGDVPRAAVPVVDGRPPPSEPGQYSATQFPSPSIPSLLFSYSVHLLDRSQYHRLSLPLPASFLLIPSLLRCNSSIFLSKSNFFATSSPRAVSSIAIRSAGVAFLMTSTSYSHGKSACPFGMFNSSCVGTKAGGRRVWGMGRGVGVWKGVLCSSPYLGVEFSGREEKKVDVDKEREFLTFFLSCPIFNPAPYHAPVAAMTVMEVVRMMRRRRGER